MKLLAAGFCWAELAMAGTIIERRKPIVMIERTKSLLGPPIKEIELIRVGEQQECTPEWKECLP